MKILSSLRSRMFLASAVLAVLCIGVAIYLVSVRVTQEAETTLEHEMNATALQVEQLRALRTQNFTLMALLIADLPKLKAAIETNDPETVQPIADGYREKLNASLVVLTNKSGNVLYESGGTPGVGALAASQPAVRAALAGRESLGLLAQPNGILQLVTVPVTAVTRDLPQPELLGTLSVGFLLDDALAQQLKKITGSDLAFGMDGKILAATLPREHFPRLADLLHSSGTSGVWLGDEEYRLLPRPLIPPGEEGPPASGPIALILRSRTEQLHSLQSIHTALAATAVVAILIGTLLSFAVARTITSPLAAITDAMREVAATGDLTRKIAVRHGHRWDDEDARLLATTFNTLTDSIARFQREISVKERLTSLGRMSTVIAHEVRNPLMIIKASLHTLRQPDVRHEAIREAATDIDEEVERLNRIVNEVLDFARPINFQRSVVDLNALCRESASAALASDRGATVELDLDPAVTTITTDPERLRIALVNMLVNARHAVNGRKTATAGNGESALVTLRTKANGDRVRIVVADRGVGIDPQHLSHVFDPYFTTKRGGTGLGLPIAKNIVEGLGGTIAVSSVPARGTEIRIELPQAP